jgi:hypothetical protein
LKFHSKLFVSIGFVMLSACGFFGKSVLWEKNLSSEPAPERFLYLLFPKHGKIKLNDEKGFETAFYLDRALIASQREIDAKVVGVDLEDKNYKVEFDRLTVTPPSERHELIAKWKTERSKRGEKVEINYLQLPDGKLQAILTVNSSKDHETFSYSIVDDNIFPEKWEIDRAKHLAQSN